LIVAVVGSREGIDRMRVERFMALLWVKQGPTTTVISGGAEGVDKWAEIAWLAHGGKVISLRPVQINGFHSEDEYAIERWELGGPSPYKLTLKGGEHPTFASYGSAATYRDMLIAEEATRGVAFRYKKSRGTTNTVGFFEAQGKPIHVFDEGEQDGIVQE
jgi:hypothetical protein